MIRTINVDCKVCKATASFECDDDSAEFRTLVGGFMAEHSAKCFPGRGVRVDMTGQEHVGGPIVARETFTDTERK